MKKEVKKLHPVSEAERCAFFEQLFKNQKIAAVNSNFMCRVAMCNGFFYRKDISRRFHNLEITGYQIGNDIIIWQSRSDKLLLLQQNNEAIDLFGSKKGYNFFIRRLSKDGILYEKYTYDPKEEAYSVEISTRVPTDFDEHAVSAGHPHSWVRMFPHEDEETKSTDNTIFYGYIRKYGYPE